MPSPLSFSVFISNIILILRDHSQYLSPFLPSLFYQAGVLVRVVAVGCGITKAGSFSIVVLRYQYQPPFFRFLLSFSFSVFNVEFLPIFNLRCHSQCARIFPCWCCCIRSFSISIFNPDVHCHFQSPVSFSKVLCSFPALCCCTRLARWFESWR